MDSACATPYNGQDLDKVIRQDSVLMPKISDIPRFQHSRLNADKSEIRLIVLQPGSYEDEIQFELHHVSLILTKPPVSRRLPVEQLQNTMPKGWTAIETDQYAYRYLFEEDETMETSWKHPDPTIEPELWSPCPENPPSDFEPNYEALSYTWGSQSFDETATVIGDKVKSSLAVTSGLATALRCLRFADQVRTLWIDAVCINQSDLEERSQQVQRMSEIYTFAKRVVVWIGPKSENSSLALRTLDYLGSQIELGRDMTRYRSPDCVERDWFRAIWPLPYDDEIWSAISDLFGRDYFERLWIWQETQLANSQTMVVCGNDVMLWRCLRHAVSALATKSSTIASLRPRLRLIYPLMYETVGTSASLLLTTSRARKCTDPRDKIYGLLSLVGGSIASHVSPDYTKDASEVYKDTFTAYSKHTRRLDLLSACDSSDHVIQCPSWIPDLFVPRSTWPLTPFQLACGISSSIVSFPSPNVMRATGVVADRIEKLGDSAPVDPAGCLSTLRMWGQIATDCNTARCTEETLLKFLWTIRAGYLADRMPRYADYYLSDWKRIYLDEVLDPTQRYDGKLLNDSEIEWCFRLISGRSLIVTQTGRFGLAPRESCSGDIVVVFLGCRSPIVVRGLTNGIYKVVGECYIDGLEDGEAVLGQLPNNWGLRIDKPASGIESVYEFVDFTSGQISSEDPRLGALPSDWEASPRPRNKEDPSVFVSYRNKLSGEKINSDPRLTPDALRRQGILLEDFDLV